MPYGNAPANDPADQVRFWLGDTNNSALLLSDEEVAFLLLEESDNTLRAAARAAEVLSAKFTQRADSKRVGPLSIVQSNRNKSKGEEYAGLALRLWARANANTGGGPYAGGISVADKESHIQDTDRVRPAFSRRMMSYPETQGSSSSTSSPQERWSPPPETP